MGLKSTLWLNKGGQNESFNKYLFLLTFNYVYCNFGQMSVIYSMKVGKITNVFPNNADKLRRTMICDTLHI